MLSQINYGGCKKSCEFLSTEKFLRLCDLVRRGVRHKWIVLSRIRIWAQPRSEATSLSLSLPGVTARQAWDAFHPMNELKWNGCQSLTFLPKRPLSGSSMTLEAKFIQKEGARKVIIGIIVFLVEISWQCWWSHSNMWRWLFTRNIIKYRMNFVDLLLYM